MMNCRWLVPGVALLLTLTGCAAPPLAHERHVAQPVPEHWQAALPQVEPAAELHRWWQAQNEPELLDLIDAAQQLSPDIAAALARIAQAQAQQALARGIELPQVAASLSASRLGSPLQVPALGQIQAGLQLSWELDLASAQQIARQAAVAQTESAQAQWHDARVLVAAEVANLYYNLRSSTQQRQLAEADALSREEAVRLTQRALHAGVVSPSELAQTQVQAAEGRSRVLQWQAACDIQYKGLSALSGQPEAQLRQHLQAALQRETSPAPLALPAIAAQTLAQRPDIFRAEREVLQAQAHLIQTQASRLPRLSLQGLIGHARISTGATVQEGVSWSFGPLGVSLPVFDAGQRAAQERADAEALRAAVSAYQSRVRLAVREVEEALVQLHSVEQRWHEASTTAGHIETVLHAQHQQRQQGLLSQRDWLVAQRQGWAARMAVHELNLQRQLAWITLYRAAGGGFTPATLASRVASS